MKLLLSLLTFATMVFALDNTTCQKCHPKIYKEYQTSAHKNASIYNDPVHKAIWDMHPAKKKGNYKCAKCHTPADYGLIAEEHPLEENAAQHQEPISCQICHKIERIEEHAKANKNIYSKKEKTFFTANKAKKGTKLLYHDEKSFLGLFKTRVGSPYHDIDYSNEAFYTGALCLGCHDHKQNGKGFVICDMQIKKSDTSKETCISCHMPKVSGSFVNQKDSKVHAFHGMSALTLSPTHLSKHIKLSLAAQEEGFDVLIENKANHTLASQPLRLSMLKVLIQRGGTHIKKEQTFEKIIGTKGEPSPPWLATEVLKDTLIKAFEKRQVHFDEVLQKGDEVLVEFGYYLVNPKLSKKFQLTEEKYQKFIVLSKKRIVI